VSVSNHTAGGAGAGSAGAGVVALWHRAGTRLSTMAKKSRKKKARKKSAANHGKRPNS
jgi:hypothetical protein